MNFSYIMIINVVTDIEMDGPAPGLYSIISAGFVALLPSRPNLYVELRPISDQWQPEALAISGFSREKTLSFPDAAEGIKRIAAWVDQIRVKNDVVKLWADNPQFDGGALNWYFHKFLGYNPFGWSCGSISCLYKGAESDMRAGIRKLRQTPHTHNALEDALGNAEALEHILRQIHTKKS